MQATSAAYVFFHALVLPGTANQRVPVGRHKGVCTLMVEGVLWSLVLLLHRHLLSCWQRRVCDVRLACQGQGAGISMGCCW